MLRINNLRCCFLINYKQVLYFRMRLNRKYFSILISYIICSDWHVSLRAFIYFSKMFVLINRQVGFLNEPKIFFYSYYNHMGIRSINIRQAHVFSYKFISSSLFLDFATINISVKPVIS